MFYIIFTICPRYDHRYRDRGRGRVSRGPGEEQFSPELSTRWGDENSVDPKVALDPHWPKLFFGGGSFLVHKRFRSVTFHLLALLRENTEQNMTSEFVQTPAKTC